MREGVSRKVVSLVLGGGRGTRLYPLTKYRAKPAVPLAGKYRLIDIPLSNCINSGLKKVYVLTQFMSVSLHRHIRHTYQFDLFSDGFVELLAAQQTMDDSTTWYQGTADAVRKNMRYLMEPGVEYVLILSGDQLYRMDFAEMIQTHLQAKADVTIAAKPVTHQEASSLGIMKIDDTCRVTGFVEKPKTDEELADVRMDPALFASTGILGQGRDCLASMGIYLFNRDLLVDLLTQADYADFGRQIFPQAIKTRHVQVHLFDGYWEDIGTIKAFYDASLSLIRHEPPFDLSWSQAPVYTRARFLPPSRVHGATVNHSLIADGCQVGDGCVIENSIIGLRCVIEPGVTIRNSIVMGADYYERKNDPRQAIGPDYPPVGIGAGTLIEGAIVDKNCRIGRHVRIINSAGVINSPEDSELCVIRDGIPVVLKDAVLKDHWELGTGTA